MAMSLDELQSVLAGNSLLGRIGLAPPSELPALVQFDFLQGPLDAARGLLAKHFHEYGYALFSLTSPVADIPGSLSQLAHVLGLGKPFVPPLYNGPTARLYDRHGFNLVTAGAVDQAAFHPVFESRDALEFHVDGTLQPIGEICTVMLFCETPAAQGGETTLFHASAAFMSLARRSPRLARALLDPRALGRRATVNNSQAVTVGPVFAIDDGHVMSRYSVNPRDVWAFDAVDDLADAYVEMSRMSQPDSPFFTRIRLRAGDGILIANDRVSHGRTSFEDSASQTRLMHRGLFCARPQQPKGQQGKEKNTRLP